MSEFLKTWWERIKKGDIFPLFIIGALVGVVVWMFLNHFPWGIIATMAGLGITFGVIELIWKTVFKQTVSQEWWKWAYKTAPDPTSKYLRCPNCQSGFAFPNKAAANSFGLIFVGIILIITFGHLLWR